MHMDVVYIDCQVWVEEGKGSSGFDLNGCGALSRCSMLSGCRIQNRRLPVYGARLENAAQNIKVR